ncbi:MAG TPA: type II toxin-antitoxin system VapC family toxin [Solirubrobacteraceae bacterium]|nr:type II toxin-antitoxin system VapC family toxin [Solirubrobacteraceae bacterium]
MPKSELFYLDASALVKLVLREPETDALVAALASDAKLVASEIAEVETLRALQRRSGGSAVAGIGRSRLENVRLLPLSPQARQKACELQPAELRSLDAIHLATALQLGDLLAGFYTYDTRLGEAATHAGLRVLAPSGENPDPK